MKTFVAIVITLLAIGCEKKVQPPSPVERSNAFYESLPLFQRPLAQNQAVPAGLPDLRAETCGQCHTEIYAEWKISTHARAWEDDAQFMEELHKSRTADGDVGWMCVNCHTPVSNQLPELVVSLRDGKLNAPEYVKNPAYDPVLQKEAITCASCHVRDGHVLGPWGDQSNAPHAVKQDNTLLTEQICTRCHQAEAVFPEINLGCFFDTGKQWEASPAAKRGETCQSCHMPAVDRPVAIQAGLKPRHTRRHWFGGSLIPKKPEFEAEIAPLRPIFGSGLEISVNPAGGACKELDDCMFATVAAMNAHAGHSVPTGDPERHVVIDITLRAGDEVIGTREMFLGSKYQWWPKIEKTSDTRVPAGEHASIRLELPKKPVTVEIVAHKYRMYEEAFNLHKLEGRYVRGREFHRSTWLVTPERVDLQTLKDDTRNLDYTVENPQ
ncbi:MAG: multiheme c-type cytochrome [bacterium]